MDLLKKSKKIIPSAMIGLMLANSISPALANVNQEVDINSFQNAQSITITQQVEQNENIQPNFQSLNVFQDHVTGKYVSAQHVFDNGGTYNNPLNPEEVMFFNVDGKNKVDRSLFKEGADYVVSSYNSASVKNLFSQIGQTTSMNIYKQKDDINDPDYIFLKSEEIHSFAFDLTRKGLDYDNMEYGKRFVLYHEFAHSMQNMEQQFNELKTTKEMLSFEFQNMSESFADVVAAIAVYKDMQENKPESELDNEFKTFMVSLMRKRSDDFVKIDKKHDHHDHHYSTIPLFVLYDLHHNNPDLFKDMDMKQAQKLGATIVNRTLNHEDVNELLFDNKQRNISKFAQNTDAQKELFLKVAEDINKEIKQMIQVNEDGKVTFEYNPSKRSTVLKGKPKSYNV